MHRIILSNSYMVFYSSFLADKCAYSHGRDLQSMVIDWLRFPLAVSVVFIHAFGNPELDLAAVHALPFSSESLFNFLRIALSHVATHFAVPVFFMFSGFLFFYRLDDFTFSVYRQKLRRRAATLLVPYVIWLLLYLLHNEAHKMGAVLIKGRPVSTLWDWLSPGIHLFWNSSVWGFNYHNWLGWPVPLTGPALIPLWFLRDLMVVVFLTPLVYWLIRRFRLVPVLLLAFCYISGIWFRTPGFSVGAFFWFSVGAYFSIWHMDMVATLYRFRFLAYGAAFCTLLPLIWLNGRMGDGQKPCVLGGVLYPVYVASAVFCAVCVARDLVVKGRVRVYPRLARASFFVFLSHPFALGYVAGIMGKLFPDGNAFLLSLRYVLTPLVTVAVCLLVYQLLERFLPRLLAVLTGSRG